MGKYLERNFLIDGMKPVIRHPSLKLFNDVAGANQTFDGYPDNIQRIEFQDLAIKLEDTSFDQFAFVLLENPAKSSSDGGNLELRLGTKNSPDRLAISSRVRRTEGFAGTDAVLVDSYKFARKLKPDDDQIRIASTSIPGTSNILDNHLDGEGEGYQLPPTVILRLQDDGKIIIEPDYPPARRGRPQRLLQGA